MKQWISECLEAFLRMDHEKGKKILQSNLPEKLYKYCRLNEYTIRNLTSQKFYMATLDNLNDPYEFQPTVDFETQLLLSIIEDIPLFLNGGLNITESDIEELKTSKDRFNTFKEICNAKGYPLNRDKKDHQQDFYRHFHEMLQSVKELMRFQSFSEKNYSTVMWSHYADCHKGICIEYDPISIGYKIPLLEVEYSDQRLDISQIEFLDTFGFNRMIYNTMLLKANDWSYEKEWRILYFLHNKSDTKVPLTIPAPKPKAIYLGAHFNKNDELFRNTLLDYAEKEKIPLYNVSLDMLSFKMVPE